MNGAAFCYGPSSASLLYVVYFILSFLFIYFYFKLGKNSLSGLNIVLMEIDFVTLMNERLNLMAR